MAMNNLIKPHTIKKMVKLTKESDKIRREIGAALCEVKGKIELGRKFVGKKKAIEMKNIPKCKVGKQIGTFHTHPNGLSVPTPMDQRVFLKRVWRSKSKLMCVGSPTIRWGKRKRKIRIMCIEPTKDELAVKIKNVYMSK